MTHKFTQSDMDSAARGLRMLSLSPGELDSLAAQHADSDMFAGQVIAAAARQMAAAKRRVGAA